MRNECFLSENKHENVYLDSGNDPLRSEFASSLLSFLLVLFIVEFVLNERVIRSPSSFRCLNTDWSSQIVLKNLIRNAQKKE